MFGSVALFGGVWKPLGSGVLLEEVCRMGHVLRHYHLDPMPICTLTLNCPDVTEWFDNPVAIAESYSCHCAFSATVDGILKPQANTSLLFCEVVSYEMFDLSNEKSN